MKKDNKSNVIIIVILLLMLAGIIYVPKYIKNSKKNKSIVNFNIEKKESYKPNEIVPIYIDDEQMSKIYYKDYLNALNTDMDSTYNLLEVDYRESVFENIYNYKKYIDSLELTMSSSVVKYATYERGKYKYYDIYDNGGNRFIFKTNGVMQYKLFFDDIDEGEDE